MIELRELLLLWDALLLLNSVQKLGSDYFRAWCDLLDLFLSRTSLHTLNSSYVFSRGVLDTAKHRVNFELA